MLKSESQSSFLVNYIQPFLPQLVLPRTKIQSKDSQLIITSEADQQHQEASLSLPAVDILASFLTFCPEDFTRDTRKTYGQRVKRITPCELFTFSCFGPRYIGNQFSVYQPIRKNLVFDPN